MPESYILISEAAQLLQVSPRRVRYLAESRGWKLKFVHARLNLVRRRDVERELAKRLSA